jgi:hypothetical protein
LRLRPREQNEHVGSARVAPNVWSGTALAGLLLAALVWAAWPEPASPMGPAAEQPAPALVVRQDPGPPPVPSDAELQPDYVAESPEELGAEPLPDAAVTPEPPPAAG